MKRRRLTVLFISRCCLIHNQTLRTIGQIKINTKFSLTEVVLNIWFVYCVLFQKDIRSLTKTLFILTKKFLLLRHGKYKIVVKQFLQLKKRTLNKPKFNWSRIFDENLLLLLLWPTKFMLKIENVEWKTNHLFLCNLLIQGQNASVRNRV